MNKQLFSKGVTTVTAATPGNGTDRTVELQYTDQKVIGNGSFGVVYLAKLVNENNENVAIKKVLQDKRFKVGIFLLVYWFILLYILCKEDRRPSFKN